MGVCFICGYAQGIMGYPTPYPAGSDPNAAMATYMSAYEKEAKIEFYFQLFLIAALGLIKLAITFFYRRMFLVHKHTRMDFVFHVLIGTLVAWTLAFFLLFLFGCKEKIYLHWAPLDEVKSQCGNALAAEAALVISDLITDLMIFLLPLPIIWRLQMRTGQKLALTGVFCVGFMAVIASVVRLAIYLIVYDIGYDARYDLNQTVTTMLWWSMIEAALGLLASCLPVIRSLFNESSLDELTACLRARRIPKRSVLLLDSLTVSHPTSTPSLPDSTKVHSVV
ncbi:uncharacterized protein BO97DRAFT_346220 [Aspergillus homomorphus CBS 101889]|uniref:Rhodopsin domain-containing protein n=1 Tax=Aspergillus homomorphus (strain CBS 101889) TaxID=1450537 RepID=A0A395HV60_ASPHC|nr:hypothetical protein BO97DRAFT_346220 [Aspergillus homomorphus CBS 101889]RAL11811.1 hypothetical protein BO97DRAFT_346220 [Aspergillus homomorphus CBS 101889]